MGLPLPAIGADAKAHRPTGQGTAHASQSLTLSSALSFSLTSSLSRPRSLAGRSRSVSSGHCRSSPMLLVVCKPQDSIDLSFDPCRLKAIVPCIGSDIRFAVDCGRDDH